MKLAYVALLCATITTTANAAVVVHHDYTPERAGAANAGSATVGDRAVGFVTCGSTSNPGYATSTGCKVDGTVIPWKTLPGYRLPSLPASYTVTAISFDSYNRIATVYFDY